MLLVSTDRKPMEVIFEYEGPLEKDFAHDLPNEIHARIIDLGDTMKVARRVWHVLVESIQNVLKHASEGPMIPHASIAVFRNNKEYQLEIGNETDRGTALYLEKKVRFIRTLEPDRLSYLYRKIAKDQALSEKGGAGLGLLDIARRTEGRLSCKIIHPQQKSTSIFTIFIQVPLESSMLA